MARPWGCDISPSAKAVGSRRSVRGDAAVPQTPKTAAKKRPVPTRRSPVVKGAKTPAPAHGGAEDDIKITALALVPGKLSPEMAGYFKKCVGKVGFVPYSPKAFGLDDRQ